MMMNVAEAIPAQPRKVQGSSEADTESTACNSDRDAESSEEAKEVSPVARKLLSAYGQRFGELRQGDVRPLAKKPLPWMLATEPLAASPEQDCPEFEEPADEEDADSPQHKKLQLTFGYAGGLEENPPYVKFDVRDHVCMRTGGFRHGQVVKDVAGEEFVVVGVRRVEGAARLWFQPRSLKRPAAGAFPGAATVQALRSRLSPVQKTSSTGAVQRLSVRLREASVQDFDVAEGSDGEELLLCEHCGAPIGETAYDGQGCRGHGLVHGECMAQHMLRSFQNEQQDHSEADALLKNKRRGEYDIGWQPERIPRNLQVAERLGCGREAAGMCCLLFDKENNSVRVTSTVEPAAAVNLEYLCIALHVRLREGREPMFSLDPVDPAQPGTMQFKRFEPEWLAKTAAGEVLFQADYHLKELSMGEVEQPVLGMKSCFDFSQDEGHKKEWSAREWFVVNRAEVQLSEDDVLIPHIRMGIQAREQVLGADGGLEDCELTRPDHPLVKYAEVFTKNFDLIAERKSVIYQLREFAKATVMAKFLLESDVFMDEAWLAGAPQEFQQKCMEIPQLWNERCHSEIRMKDGLIVREKGGFGAKVHSVYGGIDFGLGRFRLSAAQRPSGVLSMAMSTPPHVRPHSLGVPPGFEPKKVRGQPVQRPAIFFPKPALKAAPLPERPLVVVPPTARPAAPPKGAVPPRPAVKAVRPAAVRPARPVRAARPVAPAAGVEARGVDLNLDEFDLSAPQADLGTWDSVQTAIAGAGIGAAFWSEMADENSESFSKEDKNLLGRIFNPHLSDRKTEGNLFVPPSTDFGYLERLRELLTEEEGLKKQRLEHFCSGAFVMDDAGPLFPVSWRPSVEIASAAKQAPATLSACRDFKAKTAAIESMLKSTSPVFDKTAEEGTRYRIYRLGSLEVRTTQSHHGEEVIGAVLSNRSNVRTEGTVSATEKVFKVTEYVEMSEDLQWKSYVVLETEQGNTILTEQLKDGQTSWEENPGDLQDRNSLAKVVRTACQLPGVLVQDMKLHRDRNQGAGSSASKCRRYAQSVFGRAIGAAPSRICSGFRQRPKAGKWRLAAEGELGKRAAGARAAGGKNTVRPRREAPA